MRTTRGAPISAGGVAVVARFAGVKPTISTDKGNLLLALERAAIARGEVAVVALLRGVNLAIPAVGG